MKTLEIKHRTILERTGFRAHAYRQRNEYIVTYGGRVIMNDRPLGKIRVPFVTILRTRSKKHIEEFVSSLGRTCDEQRLKFALELEGLTPSSR